MSTWVASYPRSGNTYVRAFLASYFMDYPLNINALGQYGYGEHDERVWALATGWPNGLRSFEFDWRHRDDYFSILFTSPRRGSINPVKTHTANVQLYGYDAFHFRAHDRIIHIVRHPCDVAVSLAAYTGISIDAAIDQLTLDYACTPPDKNTRWEYRDSWVNHTISWLEESRATVLLVRFDDLCANPAEQFQRIFEFLGVDIDADRFENTLRQTTFQALRDQEMASGFDENIGLSSFFRVGRPNQWRDILSSGQALRLTDGIDPVMQYLDFDLP